VAVVATLATIVSAGVAVRAWQDARWASALERRVAHQLAELERDIHLVLGSAPEWRDAHPERRPNPAVAERLRATYAEVRADTAPVGTAALDGLGEALVVLTDPDATFGELEVAQAQADRALAEADFAYTDLLSGIADSRWRRAGFVIAIPLVLGAIAIILVLRDIGRRRRRAAVAEAHGFFGEMLDELPERLCRYRLSDHVIVYCNDAWAAGHGGSAADFIGRSLDELLTAGELEGLRSQLGRLGSDHPVLEDPEPRPAPEDPERRIWWVDTLFEGSSHRDVLATGRDVTARVRAEDALRASEERHRRLVELLPVPAYVRHNDGTIVAANPAFATHLGRPGPEAIVGTNIVDHSHPEDRDAFSGPLDPGERRTWEIRQVRADGEVRTVEVRVVGALWEGEPAVLGVAIDVTDIRAAQAALAASEARYRLFAEATGDGLAILSLAGEVLEANSRFYETHGLDPGSPEPLRVQDFDVSMQDADVPAFLGGIREPRVFESWHLRADGGAFPAEVDMRPIRLGSEAVVFCTVHDLSVRYAAEARVAASERQLAAVVNTVDEGIVLVDGQARVVLANESAGALLAGGNAELLVGRPGSDLLVGADVVLPDGVPPAAVDPVRWALLTGDTVRGIEVGLRPSFAGDGERWLRVSASPLLSHGDAVSAGVVVSLSDVTDEHDARVALAASEAKYRLLTEYASDLVLLVDVDGRVAYVSPSSEEQLGVAADCLIGTRWTDHMHPDDLAHIRSLVQATGDGERGSGEVRLLRGDGQYHWFEAVWRATVRGNGREIYAIARDVQARKDAEADLFHRACHDVLTGLANRRLLEQKLAEVLTLPRTTDGAVLYIDLDRFKPVNDELGHDAGDALLVAVGERLRAAVRAGDTVARVGGDEFVVLAPLLRGADDAFALARRLEAELSQPFELDAGTVTISASVGAVMLDGQGDPASLLAEADSCMYARKRGRRVPA
jgi:diguanylate cyclase (GGDEF)-like protein/PAS domain S-box-containing protein